MIWDELMHALSVLMVIIAAVNMYFGYFESAICILLVAILLTLWSKR